MARLKKKAKRRISLVFILIVLLFGVYFIQNRNNNPIDKIINIVLPENPIKTYQAKLIATGDGLIHSPLYRAAYKNGGYDFTGMLTYTKEKLKDYDIKYYNQETVFDDSKSPSSYPIFNTPSSFGDAMIDAGFNMVSLATNHSMDAGESSALKSAAWWEDKKDVLTNGMASSEEKRNEYDIKEVNNITYTMLSYTYGTNGIRVPSSKPWLVNLYDEETVKKDIAAVRDKVDVLIVAMHWGQEYRQDATETQKSQAKFLADNGVDIILGNHSHCIEPWERIGNTVVFYSFGNFISNQMGAEQANVRKVGVIGMFGTLDITKVVNTKENTKEILINNIGADLNYTYKYTNNGKIDYTVIPFSQMESKYLNYYYQGKSLESVYNEFSKVLTKYDDSIKIEALKELPTN
jgi:poly-gamma-glutamate synthesis protein (capsule biosynthesis protein)